MTAQRLYIAAAELPFVRAAIIRAASLFGQLATRRWPLSRDDAVPMPLRGQFWRIVADDFG
jgi:hypothetical protein